MLCHLDADAFFASVLQRKHPHLRGKPLLALGMGGSCVIAASYEAKAKGVRTGMRLSDAMRLVPDAIRMSSDFRETGLASQQIEGMLRDRCRIVEQLSIDEWVLDLVTLAGGIPLQLESWAATLQADVCRSTGISVSVGVAGSKTLAKMASEEKKPAGCVVLRKENVEAFLRRRPAAAIPGIGRRRQIHAQAQGWETAWDVAVADRNTIVHLCGRPGLELQREIKGERLYDVIDEPPPPKSVSRCRSFRALRDEAELWGYAMQHLSAIVLRMRNAGRACSGVSLWLRDGKYEHASTHIPVPQTAQTEAKLLPFARACFRRIHDRRQAYTQVGVALWGLRPAGGDQVSLFDSPQQLEEDESLQSSLDVLRTKYGKHVITRGDALRVKDDSKPGLGLPTLG